MRSRGDTGGSHIPDDLFLGDLAAHLQALGKARKVHVGRHVNAVVFDFHVIPSSVRLVAFRDDFPAADGIDGSACRGGIVHSVVGAVAFQDRMETAVAETRRDAEKVQRGFQEGTLQAVSPVVVIEHFAVLFEGNGVMGAVPPA